MARGDYTGRVRTSATDEVGQLATAFNRMAEDLARVDRERRDLIATVSHELRTPLTAMTALLENLADGVGARRLPAPRRRARGGAAPGPAGRGPAPALPPRGGRGRPGPPGRGAARAVEDVVAQVRATGRTLDVAMDVADDLVVAGDPARLRQLLVNVVDNAARHAPAERPSHHAPGPTAGPTAARGGSRSSTPAGEWRRRTATASSSGSAPTAPGGPASDSPWPGGWPSCTEGPSASSTPRPGRGARIRLEVPGERATAVLTSPTPVPSDPAPAAVSRTDRRGAGDPAPQSGLDAVFGRFWPDRAAPHGLRTVVAAAGAGLVAGIALSFTAVGITWTLVALTCGAAALATARRRREPWTLAVRGTGRAARAADDPARRLVGADAGARRGGGRVPVRRHRSPHAARHPAVRDGVAARVAARPAVVRPVAPDRRHRVAHAGRGAYDGVVAAGPRRLRHDLRQRQPRLRVVGRPARAQPDLQRPRRYARSWPASSSRSPSAPPTSRSTPPTSRCWAGDDPRRSPTASSGSSRCSSSTPCSSPSSPRRRGRWSADATTSRPRPG